MGNCGGNQTEQTSRNFFQQFMNQLKLVGNQNLNKHRKDIFKLLYYHQMSQVFEWAENCFKKLNQKPNKVHKQNGFESAAEDLQNSALIFKQLKDFQNDLKLNKNDCSNKIEQAKSGLKKVQSIMNCGLDKQKIKAKKIDNQTSQISESRKRDSSKILESLPRQSSSYPLQNIQTFISEALPINMQLSKRISTKLLDQLQIERDSRSRLESSILQLQKENQSKQQKYIDQIMKIKQELQQKKNQIQRLIKENSQLNTKLQQQKRTIKSLLEERDKQDEKIKKLEKQKNNKSLLSTGQSSQAESNLNQDELRRQKNQELIIRNRLLAQQIQKKDQESRRERQERMNIQFEKQQLVMNLQKKISLQQQKLEERQRNQSNSDSNNRLQQKLLLVHFSHSKILPDYKDHQNAVRIRKQLISLFQNKVASAQLIFAYDRKNISHYDKYIQGKSNLLILIQLKNGVKTGGFQGFVNQEGNYQKSFLFSIPVKGETMRLTTSKSIRKISDDPSYLSFGAAQLKIRSRCLNMTSNVGGFQSVYTVEGQNPKINKFLGSQQRQQEANAFQIFQIVFDTDEN